MRTRDLLSKVRLAVEEGHLLERADRVVAAVSGGPDSICLLSLLLHLRDEWALSIHVAHLNHGVRGVESDEDAEWVSAMAERLGVPGTVRRVDPKESVALHGLSPEEGLRYLRHRFLFEVAETVGASKIATGHTLNDQAETLLLRLARGTGLSGMGGMLPMRGKLIRPLLRVTRREIIDYLETEGLEYREDSSNRRLDYSRNRVRMKVIPALEKYCNLRIVELLGRFAELARSDNSYLDEAAEREMDQVVIRRGSKEMALDRGRLVALDVALTRRVLRAAVREVSSSLRGVTSDHILSCLHLKTGKRLHLPSGLVVSRQYDQLVLSTAKRSSRGFDYEFEIPGRVVVKESGLILVAELFDGGVLKERPRASAGNEVYFDADGIEPPLSVRSRRPGDRMRPFGMEGERKVKDILIDDKVPREKRDLMPVVDDRTGILWLVGSRRSNRAPVVKSTRRVLKIGAEHTSAGEER